MSGEHPLPPGWKIQMICPSCEKVISEEDWRKGKCPECDYLMHRPCPGCGFPILDDGWFNHRECPHCGTIANPFNLRDEQGFRDLER